MTELTKGMYGSEFHNESELFGLRCGQMHCERLAKNSGWYNCKGEKLGWGDLSSENFKEISRGLEKDQYFVVLSEEDSFLRFITKSGIIGSLATVQPTVEAPGVEYVVRYAIYVIAGEQKFYKIDKYDSIRKDLYEDSGIVFTVFKPHQVESLIKKTN